MADMKILVLLRQQLRLSDGEFRRLYEEELAPLVDRQLTACAERFLDRSAMAMYGVDEARSQEQAGATCTSGWTSDRQC